MIYSIVNLSSQCNRNTCNKIQVIINFMKINRANKLNFWSNLKKPFVGLSPMDGVTDHPYRYIQKKYGQPDVVYTEFATVEGFCHGVTTPLKDFIFDENDRLDLSHDPKFVIAKENGLLVDVNEAEFEELIRVPGIGLKTARKILEKRPIKNISLLESLGVNLKKAAPFVELKSINQSKLTRWIN